MRLISWPKTLMPLLALCAIPVEGNVASDVFLRGKGCGGPGKEIQVVDLLYHDHDPKEDKCVHVTRVNEDGVDHDADPGK